MLPKRRHATQARSNTVHGTYPCDHRTKATTSYKQPYPSFPIKALYTVNPHPPPPRGFFLSSPIEGGLIEAEGLFDLEMTMVSVLNKEQEYKVKNLKYKKF